MAKKIVFVNVGGFGSRKASNGDYDKIIAVFAEMLERMTQPAAVGSGEEKVANTTIVKSTDEALEMIKQGMVDSLVFMTRGMITTAREIKRKYSRIRVVVFTGLMPDDEVIIADKGWIGPKAKEVLKRITVG